MDRQPVLAEPFRQHVQHPSRVLFTGKPYDEVVRVADEESTSLQARLHLFFKPHIEHVVQIDVGQKWGSPRAESPNPFLWEYTPAATAVPGTCRTGRVPAATRSCPPSRRRSPSPSVRPRPRPRLCGCVGTHATATPGRGG